MTFVVEWIDFAFASLPANTAVSFLGTASVEISSGRCERKSSFVRVKSEVLLGRTPGPIDFLGGRPIALEDKEVVKWLCLRFFNPKEADGGPIASPPPTIPPL